MAQERSPKLPPLSLVDYVEDSDLRTINWNQDFLEEVKGEWRLKHGEAVLYSNVAKDRFRLVACFYNMAVLVMPPVNPDNRLGLFLKISEFLKKFKVNSAVTEAIAHEIKTTKQRILDRKAAAIKAKIRRRAKQ